MKYSALIAVISTTLAVWLLSLTGVTGLLSGPLYDFFAERFPESAEGAKSLLLIPGGPETELAGDETWYAALRTIESLGARVVVFGFIPRNTSEAFFTSASEYGNVVFGRRVTQREAESETWIPEALPAAAENKDLAFAAAAIPPSEHGISRKQRLGVMAEGKYLAAIATAAANRFGPPQESFPRDTYLINFNGKAHAIPEIALERVLDGELVSEMVEGRVALLGPDLTSAAPGLHTPITPKVAAIDVLRYEAYALNSLLEGNWISDCGPWTVLVLLFLLCGFAVAAFDAASTKFLPWLFAIFLGTLLAVTWLLLALFSVWPPIVEVSIAMFAVYLIVARWRAMSEEDAANDMLISTSARLRQWIVPESFYSSPEYWTQVITMVNQTLDLNRTIFLERVEGDHRVREVKALNCSLSDILEQRRDYERYPYSAAIEINGPVKVESRPYFKDAGYVEDHYLVPLSFGGQVLGFWAFGIEPARAAQITMFDSVLRSFGAQISELLYRRQQWLTHEKASRGRFRQYLRMRERGIARTGLNKAVALLERRLVTLDTVFDSVSTGAILYDVFGRVIHVNRRMAELLKPTGIAPFDMTVMDLVTKLTGGDSGLVRRLLRGVVLDREMVTLPAPFVSENADDYMLNVGAIRAGEEETVLAEAFPFQVFGVLVQLFDVSDLRRHVEMKQKLLANITYRLRNDLQSVVLALALLAEEDLPGEDRVRIDGMLRFRSTGLLNYLSGVQGHLTQDVVRELVDQYPVDAKEIVEASLGATAGEREHGRIACVTQLPAFPQLVWASPTGLPEVIETILRVLAGDTAEGGEVRIAWEEDVEMSTFCFSNTGFGIPAEALERQLFGDAPSASGNFRKLRELIPQVRNWRGNLEASSTVGAGLEFRLRLRRFV